MTIAPPNLLALSRILAQQAGDDEAEALRAAVDRVIAGDEESLDAAFGLRPEPGGRHWRTITAQEQRDDLIRRIRSEFFPERSDRQAAEAIAQWFTRFQGDWRRTRTAATCPFSGGIKAKLWSVLKLRDQPLGASRIRQILASELPPIDWPEDGRFSDQR